MSKLAYVTGGMGGLGETISTKMADAGYRVAALLKWAIEKRQPSRLKLGSE